jgi:hypothetical protein
MSDNMAQTLIRIAAVSTALLTGEAAAQTPDSLTAEARAFRERREYHLRDGGVWWAANPAYKPGDSTVVSHFGYRFAEGYGLHAYRIRIVGRLDTREFVFWEGVSAWHPIRNAWSYQAEGTGGAVAIGASINREGDLVFDVIAPDGTVTTNLDRDSVVGPDEFTSESFRLTGGRWTPNQRLTWKRERKR